MLHTNEPVNFTITILRVIVGSLDVGFRVDNIYAGSGGDGVGGSLFGVLADSSVGGEDASRMSVSDDDNTRRLVADSRRHD